MGKERGLPREAKADLQGQHCVQVIDSFFLLRQRDGFGMHFLVASWNAKEVSSCLLGLSLSKNCRFPHLCAREVGGWGREGTMWSETSFLPFVGVFALNDFKLSGSFRFLRFVLKIGVFSTVFLTMRTWWNSHFSQWERGRYGTPILLSSWCCSLQLSPYKFKIPDSLLTSN